jgi:hypothetical protein
MWFVIVKPYLACVIAFIDLHRDNLSRHFGSVYPISTTLIDFSFNRNILGGELFIVNSRIKTGCGHILQGSLL